MTVRPNVLVDWLILGGSFFILTVGLHFFSPPDFGRIDFAEYWAAMRIAWSGGNPYDPQALWHLQEPLLRGQVDSAVRMWNPPLIAPFIFWLGFCSFEVGRSVWLASAIAVLAFMILTWKEALGPYGSQNKRFLFFALTWYPAAVCLSYGQLSWLFAGMISALMYLIWHGHRERERRVEWIYGAVLGAAMMKPHLFSLWLVVMIVDLCKRYRWRAPLAWLATVVASAVAAELLFPGIWRWYLDATREPPLTFMTPTLGSLLQSLFDFAPVFWRFAPLVIGSLICAVWRWRSTRSIDDSGCREAAELAVLLPASLIISPYGWVYDQVVLLPTVAILLSQRTSGWTKWALTVVNVPLLLTPPSWGQQTAVWYPAVIFFAGLGVLRASFPKRIKPLPASYPVTR